MKEQKLSGFTLAEVLITLGVIGVVAAITIPILINDYKKTQYVTALKKAYTEFNQALKLMAENNDSPDNLIGTDLFDPGTDNNTLGTELVKYFKLAKNCGINTGEGCFAANTNENYDGTSASNDQFDSYNWYYKFVTMDGIAFAVRNYAADGSSWADCDTNWSLSGVGPMSQTCGEIFIDVNGPQKGPNTLGRDTFRFFITNGRGALLYPSSGSDDNYYNYPRWWNNNNANICSSANVSGWECPGRIMEKGWVMDY